MRAPRKIIFANNYLYVRGGCERYMFSLAKMLRANRFQVIYFAMQHANNIQSEYARYFVNGSDYEQRLPLSQKLLLGINVIFSFEARAKLSKLIAETKPDLFAFRNIYHHVSPSVLSVVKRHGLPVVMHIADYNIICPAHTLVRNGTPCEQCKGHRYYNAARYRCLKDSLALSVLGMVAAYVHHVWRLYDRCVDVIVAPSRFVRDKLVEFGIDANKITVVPHGLDVDVRDCSSTHDGYILFAGRLAAEKGIMTLIRAVEACPEIKLVVAGDGPLKAKLQSYVAGHRIPNVALVGYKASGDLEHLIEHAAFVVVPSEWYEAFGLSIYEAFALGKPVIGSRIGAIPEIIDDGKNGWLFTPGDVDDLRSKILELWSAPTRIGQMGRNALEKISTELSARRNYEAVSSLYQSLMREGA